MPGPQEIDIQQRCIDDLNEFLQTLSEQEKKRVRKEMFDELFPIGSVYMSMSRKQKFPFGKWKYLGSDSFSCFFKRIK